MKAACGTIDRVLCLNWDGAEKARGRRHQDKVVTDLEQSVTVVLILHRLIVLAKMYAGVAMQRLCLATCGK